jgi:hypothetical protein
VRAQERRDEQAAAHRQNTRRASAMTPQAQRVLALQRLAGNAAVARAVEEERHEHSANCGHGAEAQRSAAVQRSAVHQTLRTPGRPLDEPLRAEMETRLGADFGDVRIHSDAAAQRSAAEVGARAYTSGNHVVVGQGGADKHTLAHELTHVIQQRQGPVAGTDNGGGLRVSDPGDRFEREAEANAHRVMGAAVPMRRAEQSTGGATAAPGTVDVQRAPTAEAAKGTYRQTKPTGDNDRDVTLRMLDRMSRVALETIEETNSMFKDKKNKNPRRGAKKITPHLAVSLLPDGSLAIAGNTGDKRVTENDKDVVETALKKDAVAAFGQEFGTPKDQNKLKAQASGDYAEVHGDAPGLRAIEAALRKEIKWYAVDSAETGKVSQHGEMTVLGEHVAHWLANPKDATNPEKVMMGGVKKACRSCQWAFDAVNEHLGRPNGYEVVASGTHEQFFPGWLMPQWMRAHPAVVEAVRQKAAGSGVTLEDWVLQGAMTARTLDHAPDGSESEWESEHA